MSEEHQSFIKTPKQLIVVVALAFIVPALVIYLLVTYVDAGSRNGAGADAMTDEAIEARIRPVAKFELAAADAPAAGAPAAATSPAATAPAATALAAGAPATLAAAAAPAAAAAGADAAKGKALYDSACMACHMTGAAGAPKLGDKAAWAPRIQTGIEALVTSAIKGKGAMPPKGGSTAPDADVRFAVEYMVAQSK